MALNYSWEKAQIGATGFDPEIFVVDEVGKMIPAFHFLPSKDNPFKIPRRDLEFDIHAACEKAYWDGFQAEFTTHPSSCHEWVFDEVRNGLKTILLKARQFHEKAQLTLKNVFTLTEDELFAATPDQVALGCDPSCNAYGTDPFYVDNPFKLPYRMAGGHIHFGLHPKFKTEEQAAEAVKYLDLLVGIPTVAMFAEIDNPIRRRFYGRAGEFRMPPHGLEYRTLSNAWMGHPAVANLVADMARVSFGPIQKELKFSDLNVKPEQVRDIINESNVKAARALVEKHKLLWFDMLESLYDCQAPETFYKMVQEGVEAKFPTYTRIEKNWHLITDDWSNHSNDDGDGIFHNVCGS